MRRALPFLMAGLLVVLSALPVLAQPTPAPAAARELVVATKVAPPFAMKRPDGSWTGISIDLWQRIAEKLGVRYRLVEEPTVDALIAGTATGRYDAAVAALTITGARAEIIDFSQPFYRTGLGIAVPPGDGSRWNVILRSILSLGFLQAVGALIGLALLVGLLIWLFERRRNEHFGGTRGIGASIWWSAEAMTQASTGVHTPITLAGRSLAILWMAVSIIAIAVFTAGVTSALTTSALQGLVTNAHDLASVRVGAVEGSSTIDYLVNEQIKYRSFPSADAGLKAMKAGAIDAFVYDKPLLAWIVLQDYGSSLNVLDIVFDAQNYGIGLPLGSPLRRDIDVALLDSVHSDWWKQTLFRYLGER
ncbi:amino acid ABC transporter substrate-binding protein [Kaistia sp. 32K]|uniref:transporter substrate-binding domain-containing protein n=1 Tax=Kaistia sp. 32K TaxID=2795690 RepID=UPI0019158600|nr:transporter substrate-binding domain-containing protein [Kaistia sp. 32K]BCP54773.1 amino acid ABC transporter substrate-binding protein [Kaistia sp. 32K]